MKPKLDPDFDWCLKLHVHTVLSQEDGVFLGMFRSPNMSEELEVLKKPISTNGCSCRMVMYYSDENLSNWRCLGEGFTTGPLTGRNIHSQRAGL